MFFPKRALYLAGIFFSLICFFSPSHAFAAAGEIQATMRDEAGEPFVNATVEVSCDASTYAVLGATDDTGTVIGNPTTGTTCTDGSGLQFRVSSSTITTQVFPIIGYTLLPYYTHVDYADPATAISGSTNKFRIGLDTTSTYAVSFWNAAGDASVLPFPTGEPVATTTASTLAYDWGNETSPYAGINADDWFVEATKTVTFASGWYEFEIASDDGTLVTLDGETVINDYFLQAMPSRPYTKKLLVTGGTHTIDIKYYEHTGYTGLYFRFYPIDAPSAPIVEIGAPISSPHNNRIPASFGLHTDTAGTLVLTGGCTTTDPLSLGVGTSTVTLTTMADGTYPSCVATLTDPDTGYSSFVAVPSFTIVIPAPRHIASCEELEAISTDDTSYANDYILDNDIDCDGITLDPLTGSNSYIGTFDGGGYQITNFNLNRPGYSYLGLFTFARGATIKDLTLAAGGQITGNRAMGAIAGYADNLTLQNVRSDLLITSTLGGPSTGVGGLVGEAHFTNGSTTTWSNITVNTTVTGRGLEGGAIGRLWIDSGSTFVLEDVQLVDTITGRFAASFNTAGGLIGAANINGPARFLMRRGNLSSAITMRAGSLGGGLIGQVNASGPGVIDLSIDQVTTTGSITGRNFLGGFVGSITASNDGYPMSIQFTRSSAAMDLTGSGGSSHIGGFIGRVSWNAFVDAFTSLIFNHDDASGTIHGTNNIGGFLGGMDVAISSSGATGGLYVYNSTAYATVSGASDVGGFAGYLSCQSQNSIQFPACTFRQDRAIGTVSGDTDIGGFVGRMEGDVDVEDSYTVNALSGATNVGGFVGNLNSSHAYSNMSRVYASTTITTTGESPSNIGGLVGIAQTVNANTNLDHAFAVVSLTDPSGVATNQGWMIGNLSAFTPAHLAYHSFSGPTLSCVGNQSDTSYCTANADPNAFFQVSDEPLSDWAYNTVWQVVASSYPTLLFRDVVTYPAGASYTVSSIRTTENTALINWFTDEHASTNLYYGIGVPTIAIGSSDTPTRVTSHSASLSGLSLCTVYNFLFTSVDVYGTPSTSSQQIFQTGGCGGGGGALTAGAGGNVQMITFPNQVPALPITPPVHVSSSIPLVVTTSTNALPILEHPTSSPACPPMIFTTDLALDAVSPDVQRLQIFLNKRGNVIARTGLGSPGHESTYYGPATKRAVAAFQRANRLSMDGILNAATRERIKDLSGICLVKDVFARDLRLGMRGADVRSLQQLLNSNGFLLATDPVEARANETGYFGRATQNALRALQRARQVPPTGQVDLATRLQLNALIANRAPRS